MLDFVLPQPMAKLRLHAHDIVATVEAQASYGAVLLSATVRCEQLTVAREGEQG